MGKQVIGIIAPCTPISTKEAAEGLVEALYVDEECFLATETVVDLFHARVLKAELKRKKLKKNQKKK